MKLQQYLQTEFGDEVETQSGGGTDSLSGLQPEIIAAPKNEAAAGRLVAWCGREGVALVPRGGATKWRLGARPSALQLVLSTHHLDQIWDHDEGNATVEAGAGITLAELEARVGEKRQFLPVQDRGTATLGGVVAVNAANAWSGKYGRPRDMVTGLHACLSDGRLLKTGAKVVKNVAGYDMPKLFVGSLGTLGLITRITIRLRPRDACTAHWHGSYSTREALDAAVQHVLYGPFEPTSIRAVLEPGNFTLRLRFDGGEEAVASQLRELPTEAAAGVAPGEGSELGPPAGPWLVGATLPPASAGAWATYALELGVTGIIWDCSQGRLRASLSDPESVKLVIQLRKHAEDLGGFLLSEETPEGCNEPHIIWGPPRSDFSLQLRLKQCYDAAGVFSPGRFVGGI